MIAHLEHVNVTVKDPDATADWMCRLFGWHVRWSGAGMTTGRTVHVGTDTHYIALFTYGDATEAKSESYRTLNGLNHIAITVENLDEMEKQVKAEGFETGEHYDYEPGRRFYFHDRDGIEFEVVSYV